MDRFDAMRAFARVVEAGSFTKGCPNASYEQNHGDATHSAAGSAPARQIAPSHYPQTRCDS